MIKTINVDTSFIGEPKYEDIDFREFQKRWNDVRNNILQLHTTKTADKLVQCVDLFDQLVEASFYKTWELQQKDKE
tara:strand:+ start:2107 stop:2334 length:228 start_codon:yes stop_codon:yes gene_type:complete